MELDNPRYSGILLHPTSLPSAEGIGDFGDGAYAFVDFLQASGQKLWQVLPFGPTSYGDSPYQGFSAFAGQPLLISMKQLVKDGLLTEEDLKEGWHLPTFFVDYAKVQAFKFGCLEKAYKSFTKNASSDVQQHFKNFCLQESFWLEDYALFMACKEQNGQVSFLEWDQPYRNPTPEQKKALTAQLQERVQYYQFVQMLFFSQWGALRRYANEKGISIIGDMPLYVSLDSADVWANPQLFLLDEDGYPSQVAGVPPDYFSESGQLWGNPLYRWSLHWRTGFTWWISRVMSQLRLFDYLRIDHFRGLESCWQIPYGETTAINGAWVKVPGEVLFQALNNAWKKDKTHTGPLPIIAEDLGIITPEVIHLRDAFTFPGMKVLQFGFTDPADNDLLPHHYTTPNCVCYTGTHDNDTTKGWYETLSWESQDKLRRYLNCDGKNIHWDLIRLAQSSIARYAIYPIQDVLGFGSECRMNRPGFSEGNWQFRIQSGHLSSEIAGKLREITGLYGRLWLDKKKTDKNTIPTFPS